ncbi:DUF2929 family protein [Lactovum miscens]|uniref:DUF2929 family protein n=1 Tax=Lactovum miscens TaxID=190387 RepID=A0A841C7G1_9LACT|nr:DUF2929 family protein [Lactovum miscens]MBB5887491.1 hypothetical protein [Lactovum miscens]
MKFIVTLFWALTIGQVVAFIGAKLLSVNDSVFYAAIASAGFAVFIYILSKVAILPEKKFK